MVIAIGIIENLVFGLDYLVYNSTGKIYIHKTVFCTKYLNHSTSRVQLGVCNPHGCQTYSILRVHDSDHDGIHCHIVSSNTSIASVLL